MFSREDDLPPTIAGMLNLERKEGFEQGFKEGYKEAFKDGYKEGFSEAFREGFELNIRKVTDKLAKNGLSSKVIADVLERPLEEINAIRKKCEK